MGAIVQVDCGVLVYVWSQGKQFCFLESPDVSLDLVSGNTLLYSACGQQLPNCILVRILLNLIRGT